MYRKIFLAGATGAIGSRLTPLLLDAGYEVFRYDTLKDESRCASDPRGHTSCSRRVRCAGVVSSDCRDSSGNRHPPTTDLPAALEAGGMTEGIARTTRIRIEGTRNLVTAALESGARRLIAQSLACWSTRMGRNPILKMIRWIYAATDRTPSSWKAVWPLSD